MCFELYSSIECQIKDLFTFVYWLKAIFQDLLICAPSMYIFLNSFSIVYIIDRTLRADNILRIRKLGVVGMAESTIFLYWDPG